MTYIGHVESGCIVLEGNPVLPDGTAVRVELIDPAAAEQAETLGLKLMKYAGKAKGFPTDASALRR
jgi:hypothetical protein